MRKEVRWFAEKMEEVLRENDHRGGWEDMSALELFSCFLGEVYELDSALWHGDGDVVKECCDVANYAMMIADKMRGRNENTGRNSGKDRTKKR